MPFIFGQATDRWTPSSCIKALAHPIQQFLSAWGVCAKSPAHPGSTPTATPNCPPYELAALRGEGILRERFFGAFMARLPVQLDAAQQLPAWRSLVEDGGFVTAWVQRLGLAKALRREAVVPLSAHQEARKLYTLLLDALSLQAPEILPWSVEGYFWHCWKQQLLNGACCAGPVEGGVCACMTRVPAANFDNRPPPRPYAPLFG